MKIKVGLLKQIICEELETLSHDRKTDLSSRKISLVDFVVKYLGDNGPTKRVELERAIDDYRGWKPSIDDTPKQFVSKRPVAHHRAHHLFSREFGHVSRGFDDLTSDMKNPMTGFGTMKTTLWFGDKKGVYTLNANGMARYAKIVGTK